VRGSVIELAALVAGTIPKSKRRLRMEFWRTINLYHVCTYALADKTRTTYNVDEFVLPVATAFGAFDNEVTSQRCCTRVSRAHRVSDRPAVESLRLQSQFGMLTREELEILVTYRSHPDHTQCPCNATPNVL
jgi:hypothetical protein